MLSPLPTASNEPPESGVAEYTASLVRCLEVPITVLAQRQAMPGPFGAATVLRVWNPNLRLALQVKAAVTGIEAEILHVQHEFNLYGGLLRGALLTPLLIWLRQRVRIVTTIHGIVAPQDVTKPFLARNSLPPSAELVRSALALSYRGLDAASDLLIVHHDYFRNVLAESYGIEATKIAVIPHGVAGEASPAQRADKKSGKNVLCLGFLTGYKLPELLVEVAESRAITGATFTFCIGANPRLKSRAYRDRLAQLERRVRALEPITEWNGYVPDEALAATLAAADVLVLPYTECVAVSGVLGLARQWQLPVCYSQPLRPLFGTSSLEFALTPRALAQAIVRALSTEVTPAGSGFIPWRDAADATQAVWERLQSRR
jgi:glycosyltransferase involved in cell wall biosynthesis